MNGRTRRLERALALVWKMNYGELENLNKAIGQRWRELQRRDAFKFREGDRVSFKDREGNIHKGIVAKVNKTSIVVEENSNPPRRWRVSASMLRKLR